MAKEFHFNIHAWNLSEKTDGNWRKNYPQNNSLHLPAGRKAIVPSAGLAARCCGILWSNFNTSKVKAKPPLYLNLLINPSQ